MSLMAQNERTIIKMKKISVKTISIIMAVMMLTVALVACGDAAGAKLEQDFLNALKGAIADAKVELGKVGTKATELEADAEAEIHVAIGKVGDEFTKVEAAVAKETQAGVDEAKDILANVKTELGTLKAKAQVLEGDAVEELHTLISALESKVQELENKLRG